MSDDESQHDDDEDYDFNPCTNKNWSTALRFVTEDALREFDETLWTSQDVNTDSEHMAQARVVWMCMKKVISQVSCEQAVIPAITSYFSDQTTESMLSDPCGLIKAIASFDANESEKKVVSWAQTFVSGTMADDYKEAWVFQKSEANIVWNKWHRFLKTVFLDEQDIRRFHDKLIIEREDATDVKSYQFEKSVRENKQKLVNEIEKCQHIPSPDTHLKIQGDGLELGMIFTDYVICDGHLDRGLSRRIIERFAQIDVARTS